MARTRNFGRWITMAAFATLPVAQSLLAVEITTKADAPDALIVDDAKSTVTVTVKANEPADAGTYELRQTFVDRYGQTRQGPAVSIELKDQWKQQVNVPVEHFGPAAYRATLHKAGDGDEPVAQAEQLLIRPVAVPLLNREQRADSPIGINVHTNAHWKTLGQMGVHWARDYSWGWLGPGEQWPQAPNKTNFGKLEPTADAAGITILPVMQKAFRTEDDKYFISDGKAIAAGYERLARAVPQLKYWELDNEAELQHRDEDSPEYKKWFETYLEYIKYADQGLKAAGTGAEVVLNGEAGIHLERTQELLDKVGEHFAVINYHFYTGTVAPELALNDINTGSESRVRTTAFLDQMLQINRMAKAAGKEAWLTEIGWSARSGPAVGDRLQSAYLERLYLLSRWAGTDKVFWFWDRELKPGGRFSSMELVHSKEGARAAGAAMAAVSKYTAQASYAGSVDLGPDRWCLIFQQPDGTHTAAAWAVAGAHDLPETLASAGEAFDMYGNPLRDRQLTVEPAYFTLSQLPAAWQGQLKVEWVSPRLINVNRGASAQVEMEMPAGGTVTFDGLPEGVKADDWKQDGTLRTTTLHVPPTLEAGTYNVTAVAKGEGWQKRFPLSLRTRSSVAIDAVAYAAGKPAKIEFTNRIEKEQQAKLSVEQGTIEPANVTLSPQGTVTARYTAPEGAAGPVALDVQMADGGTEQYWIRPIQLNVPRAGEVKIDGDLSDWPQGSAGGVLTEKALQLNGPEENFQPTMRLAWSPAGLNVAARIPVGPDFEPAQDPKSFWEWTSLEMNVSTADLSSPPDPARSHLLWFTPYKDNAKADWRLYAGQWLKVMPDGKKETLNDDQRMPNAMKYDGETVTIEVLVPTEVLGATPKVGEQWGLTIHSKIAKALSPRTLAAWPSTKGGQRGTIRFVE
ncbi:MAG TPA: hypothetical protein VGN72_04055 [Tepidisphaeraceae bacterium]|jgi:hypothetical protein|nr:hypothetical protein [Tepidisphaeraceae bacterium]